MLAIVEVMPDVNASLEQETVDDKSEVFASREISALPWRANAVMLRAMILDAYQANVHNVVLIQTKMASVRASSRMVSMILVVLVVL